MLAQPLELPDGGAPVSGFDRALDECLVRFLIGGIDVQDPLPQPGRLEQPKVQGVQAFAGLLGPRCVTILGEQLPPVELERADLARASRRLEGQGVNQHVAVGA